MSKKPAKPKKPKISPGQLSLFDLSGNDEGNTSQKDADGQSQPKQPLGLAKEAATKYKATPKVVAPVEPTLNVYQSNQIPVYVGITFDPCQGIREAKQRWKKNPVPSEVLFDCRPIELAAPDYYASEPRFDELFAPEEEYLLGRGGLLSNAVFINLLRCYGTLKKWSDDVLKETGTKPIRGFKFIPPDLNTPLGKLWEVLGMPGLTDRPPKNLWMSGVMEFQSRIVTPLLMVDNNNRKPKDVLSHFHDWLDYISDRLSREMENKLWTGVCEIVKNLVDHGHRGLFGVSVWSSGQIEIVWSNPIDHIHNWPPDNTALGLANSLLSHKGAGMAYIYDQLLPRYKGVLVINWKTHHLIFRSVPNSDEPSNIATSFSIMGLQPRSDAFLPRSILFTLHLFCPETRDRSSKNASS
jgi:hypothetical protein